MQKSKSSRRRKAGLTAVFGTLALAAVPAAFFAGITPAWAANVASQADTQVAVFMVPLTLLVLGLLVEATRFVWRGVLPAQISDQPAKPLRWSPDPAS